MVSREVLEAALSEMAGSGLSSTECGVGFAVGSSEDDDMGADGSADKVSEGPNAPGTIGLATSWEATATSVVNGSLTASVFSSDAASSTIPLLSAGVGSDASWPVCRLLPSTASGPVSVDILPTNGR